MQRSNQSLACSCLPARSSRSPTKASASIRAQAPAAGRARDNAGRRCVVAGNAADAAPRPAGAARGLIEHQRLDCAAAQALFGDDGLEHRERGRERRHARSRGGDVGPGVETTPSGCRADQPGWPRPCSDLAKEERVAAPDQHQVDDEELAGVAQAEAQLLREAVAADDVVAQRQRATGTRSAASTRAKVAAMASSVMIATASTSRAARSPPKAALPPSRRRVSTASSSASARRSTGPTS